MPSVVRTPRGVCVCVCLSVAVDFQPAPDERIGLPPSETRNPLPHPERVLTLDGVIAASFFPHRVLELYDCHERRVTAMFLVYSEELGPMRRPDEVVKAGAAPGRPYRTERSASKGRVSRNLRVVFFFLKSRPGACGAARTTNMHFSVSSTNTRGEKKPKKTPPRE